MPSGLPGAWPASNRLHLSAYSLLGDLSREWASERKGRFCGACMKEEGACECGAWQGCPVPACM